MVTLREISIAAGVTPATVSNALNGKFKGTRSDATQRSAHILKIAAQMGYRINRAAKATRTGRTGCIGMLIADQLQYTVHYGDFEHELSKALRERNYLLVSDMIDEELMREKSDYVPRIVAESLVEGLLINYVAHIPAAIEKMITEHNRPAIWINSKHQADCVYPDDENAAYVAVKYLIERGHRKIAYGSVGGTPHANDMIHYSRIDRKNGYRRAMIQAGLEPRVCEREELPTGKNYKGLMLRNAHSLLTQLGDATALLHGWSSEQLLQAALSRGIRLPEDLSVISFENSPYLPGMDVTRIVVPHNQMGSEAVRLLCEKIEHNNAPQAPCVLKFGVTDGATVRVLT